MEFSLDDFSERDVHAQQECAASLCRSLALGVSDAIFPSSREFASCSRDGSGSDVQSGRGYCSGARLDGVDDRGVKDDAAEAAATTAAVARVEAGHA